ncbi:MAG: hypothetical protein IE886_08425, partial [Campylobacterales bacterium]|nr:hypothetical protein [Campylobacterales bacterium]
MALSQNTSSIVLSAATAILLTLSGCGGGGGGTGTSGEPDHNTTIDSNTTDSNSTTEDDANKLAVLEGDIKADKTLTANKLWEVRGLVKV